MLASLAADLVVLTHFGFIAFVVAGGLLVLRWPRLAWLHLPAAAWGAAIVLIGGFIEQYLIPVIYPGGLTRGGQIAMGMFVVAVNLAIYAFVLRCRR